MSSSTIDGMLLGPLLLAVGSMALFVTLRIFEAPEPMFEVDEDAASNSSATSTTATVLAFLVLGFSVLALAVQACVRHRLRHVRREKARAEQEFAAAEADRSLWERFFVPHFRPVNESATDKKTWRWSGKANSLVLAPAVSLFLIVVVRLFAGADDFEGVPKNLDFGWKYGLVPHDRDMEDGDELFNEPAEKSIAFVVEFSSYGHALQGFFAALLAFPVVARVVRKPFEDMPCCGRMGRNLVDVAPYALTLYPTYSLLKRFIKAGEAFAGSSFANNSLEWTGGFMLGLALGDLVTALALWLSVVNDEEDRSTDDEGESSSSSQDQETPSPPWWKFWEEDKAEASSNNPNNDVSNSQETQGKHSRATMCVRMLQTILGMIFQLSVTASAVLIGLTWHGCLDDSPDECINNMDGEDDIPFGLLAVLVAIPMVLYTGALFRRCKQ